MQKSHTDSPTPAIEEMVARNEAYAKNFPGSGAKAPAKRLAILACMDARLDVSAALGLRDGDAHVIRNAGGVVSDDAIRSLVISQRLLGTTEIMLIHHTDCGMQTFTDEEFAARLAAETGVRPTYPLHAFADLEDDVRDGIAKLAADVHLPHRDAIRGFVYDVETGRLREVTR